MTLIVILTDIQKTFYENFSHIKFKMGCEMYKTILDYLKRR